MTADEARAFTSKLRGYNQEVKTPPRFREAVGRTVLGEKDGNEQGTGLGKPPVMRNRATYRGAEYDEAFSAAPSPPRSPPPPPPPGRAPSRGAARRHSFPETAAEAEGKAEKVAPPPS